MHNANRTLSSLLLQLLLAVSFFTSLGYMPSALAAGYTLTTNASPTAGGTVVPYGGSYLNGAKVTMTATPKTGYKFSSWSGCSSSSTTCTVTMTKNTAVTASFTPITYTLSVAASTGGKVSSSGGSYAYGTNITLTATPNTGYKFSGWSGGCSGTGSCCQHRLKTDPLWSKSPF